MGGEQAAGVLATVRQVQAAREGLALTEDELDEIRAPILERCKRERSPYDSTARLWDDGNITPVQTQNSLALALAAAYNAPIPDTTFGVFRM